ncbi:MAG: AraC family transcriptional regulator [Alphaproteobacteria bacterium]|nr:AraC family transcriptional regulator [Alphaproteobacteria bacterium]
MDALSDVLRVVRIKGGVFLQAEFTAPWCVASRVAPDACRALLEGADHLVLYHYVLEGRMTARLAGRGAAPVELEAGHVLLLPHNDAHLLGSDLRLPPVPTQQLLVATTGSRMWEIRHGAGGAPTRIVCGFLGCDRLAGNPLIDSLPGLMTFDARDGPAADWIRGTLEFAAGELAAQRAGSQTMLAKLSELLFVEALRRHVDTLPADRTGWLAGLRDAAVSRALALLHREIARPWTVDDLGREVGMSRSALAERFTRLIGEPPMRYLARWRVQAAAHQLRHGDANLARIAEQVGYESEAAFSRAFKRHVGIAPALWRRRVPGN